MKKHLLYLLVAFFALTSCTSQRSHKVKQTQYFNIYEEPDTTAEILGTTKGHEDLFVLKMKNGWAEIRQGRDVAYVQTDAFTTSEHILKDLQIKGEMEDKTGWILIGIVVSMGILYLIPNKKDVDAFPLDIRAGIFNFACILELLYACVSFDNFMWFLLPRFVGIWAFLNIAILCGVAWVQKKNYYKITEEYKAENPAEFSMRWGILSGLALIPIMAVCISLFGASGIVIGILVFLACQVYQFRLIVKSMSKSGPMLSAVLCASTNVIGLYTTFAVAALAVVGFIALLLCRLFISLMGRSREDYNPYDPYNPYNHY